MRNEHRSSYIAHNAMIARATPSKRHDWTTPSRSGYSPDNARLERSHRLADRFMLGMLVVTVAGIVAKIFG